MLAIKTKKNPTEEKEIQAHIEDSEIKENEQGEENSEKKEESVGKGLNENRVDIFTDFSQLAELCDMPIDKLRDEMFLMAIKKITNNISKVIVNQSLTEEQLEKIVLLSNKLGENDIYVSPAFLVAIKRQVRKHLLEKKENICVIIDFPFGESLIRSKIISIKDCLREGADKILVTMPTSLVVTNKIGAFKKQCKRLSRITKKPIGIAINSEDLSEEQIRRIIKGTIKSKLDFITFIFSEKETQQVYKKLEIISKYKNAKKFNVLGAFESIDDVKKILTFNIKNVLTCYGDKIGEKLIEKFNIN